MKSAIALVAVGALALVLLVVYSVVQEVKVYHLKTRTAAKEATLDGKEASIVATKQEVEQLKISAEAENTKAEELMKRHEEIKTTKKESEEKLQTCNSEKETTEKKKTETETAIKLLKENPTNLQEEIDKLKKDIKDRDHIICTMAATSQDEVKKLCVEESPK